MRTLEPESSEEVIMLKDKVNLEGVEETMLIPLYARALASRRKNPYFVDEVAMAVVDNMDYDFKKHGSKMNMWGCQGRTVILDNYTREYIEAHPDATIINIACGLDDRFNRVDNGKITWYNIDLPEIMDVRHGIIADQDRVVDIAMSVFDYSWIDQIADKSEVLVIAEGVLMYFSEEQVKELYDKIAESFESVTVLVEMMTRWMVDNQKLHKVTQETSARFDWGVDDTHDFEKLCPEYKYIDEQNITDAMKLFNKFPMCLIAGFMQTRNNRIGRFVKTK